MSITREVYNLAYSCLINGDAEHTPMTPDVAADTIRNWLAEGNRELCATKGLTPETFSAAWNEVLALFEPEHAVATPRNARDGFRRYQMMQVAEGAMALLEMANPNRRIVIVYDKPDDESIKAYTEWQKRRCNIYTGNEYFIVYDAAPDWDAPGGRELLYAVNVSADSILTAAAELMDLLSRKF